MSGLRQAGLGILTAAFSTILIFGSMLLALTEGGYHAALALTSTPGSLPPANTPKAGEPTFTPSPSPLPSPSPTIQGGILCTSTPPDWIPHEVLPGETLSEIAQAYAVSEEALRIANCLSLDTLLAGSVLFVPPPPSATSTNTIQPPTPTTKRPRSECSGPPKSWVPYTVKRGDTLFRIALAYGLSVDLLQAANCLSSTTIRVGQVLYVPNVPTRTPLATATFQPTQTPPPTSTSTSPPPTATSMPTSTPSPTIPPTDAPLPTNTPVPTDTPLSADTPTSPAATATSQP